jgi:hypothetical protein
LRQSWRTQESNVTRNCGCSGGSCENQEKIIVWKGGCLLTYPRTLC